jgi:hypothetical protein
LQVRGARGRFGRLKRVNLLGFQHKIFFIFPSDPVARGALILCCQGFEEVLAVQEFFLEVLGEVVVVVGGFEAYSAVLLLEVIEVSGAGGFFFEELLERGEEGGSGFEGAVFLCQGVSGLDESGLGGGAGEVDLGGLGEAEVGAC